MTGFFSQKARFPDMKLVLAKKGFNASFYCNDGISYCDAGDINELFPDTKYEMYLFSPDPVKMVSE